MQITNITTITSKPCLLYLSIIALMNTAAAATADTTLPSTTVDPIVVVASKETTIKTPISAHDVYDNDESSTYSNQEQLERYIGESPADVFKGMVGVYSGDARNSGAIDPNVRGIQGEGRVPVTIDGTEQAITANRGYQGASNRNYIDPLLISDVKVSKGASMERGIHSSVGGAVTINTINVNDVLTDDASFGINFKGIIGNNATEANAINPTDYVGDNASNYSTDIYPIAPDVARNPDVVKVFENGIGRVPRKDVNAFTNLGLVGKTPERNKMTTSFDDKAYRIAIAGRTEWVEGVAAYSHRERGNYFAGARGSDDYRSDTPNMQRDLSQFPSYMADVYRPHQEVPNSSNENTSYLAKITFKPTDTQALQFGYRHTDVVTGDIMPFRVADDRPSTEFATTGRLPQWPLSNIDLDAYHIRYKWQPDNPWIDLDGTLWHTDTTTVTHNSGGSPLSMIGQFFGSDSDKFNQYKQGFIQQFQGEFPGVVNCPNSVIRSPDYSTPAKAADKCVQAARLYQNTFKSNSESSIHNTRYGLRLSNQSQLTDTLSMTLSGNYQQEQLEADNAATGIPGLFTVAPGKGRRRSGDVSINFNYQPYDWLELAAGARYDRYWAIDDYVNEARARHELINQRKIETHKLLNGFYKANETVQQALQDYRAGKIKSNQYSRIYDQYYPGKGNYGGIDFGDNVGIIENGQEGVAYVPMREEIPWYPDQNGVYHREDNIFLNGEAKKLGILRPAKSEGKTGFPQYILVSDGSGDPFEPTPAKEGWGWVPSVSAAVRLPWEARVYGRYAQTTRMPSMFESIATFAKNINHYDPVSPERGTNIEVGYVQDLTPWFNDARFADAKLVYYDNTIRDVVDREFGLQSNLRNFDKQHISGLELQSRYDDGQYFGDFSVGYTLENQVCDADYAVTQDPYYAQVPDCVEQGFFGGFLFNMAQPKYMLDLTLGTRLLDEKLEMGTRIHHHSGSVKNVYKLNYGDVGNAFVNIPYSWSPVTTFDYFLSYEVFKDSKLQLSATNITDEYYLDPLTRTLMPAPGRALHLSFETKF
ncbi:TonB-dependent receptor domain-containing protein [Psychrobacter sp. I-STPA10]|uniref:TonB-dependent receptor domain-containing protein n=1 Tax=Psychrobacter sp. I-STPA10 TaxID=2585769 RepID=UPI001E39C9C9|nr:TonB-dependent receptor [Psychrobacter sp. I-STPA10]